MMKTLLPLLLAAAVSVSQPLQISDRTDGTIYVGDSRFVQMEAYLQKGDEYVVAKSSMGYKWLVEEAMPEVNAIKASHPEITSWTIVSGLGVNDLYNIDNYLAEYQKIVENGDQLVVMSVNPCDGKRSSLNTNIDSFNTRLAASGLDYLDSAGYLNNTGFSTSDGVHYTKDTYVMIWNYLNDYLVAREKEDP